MKHLKLATEAAEGTPTNGAQVQWIYALSIGKTWVRNASDGKPQFLDVTLELARKILSETRKVMAAFEEQAQLTESSPVRLPVYALHAPQLGEFGHIIDTRLKTTGPKQGIWLKVAFNPRYEPGSFSHVSVGIDSEFTTQQGQTFGPVLVELSLCSIPKDTRIGTIADHAAARLAHTIATLANTENEVQMEPEEIQALIAAALAEALAPIEANQATMMEALQMLIEAMPEADEPEEPEDVDASNDDAEPEVKASNESDEVAKLSAIVTELQDEVAAVKALNVKLAKQAKSAEVGTEGRNDAPLTGDAAAKQKQLAAKGVRGSANIVAALSNQ